MGITGSMCNADVFQKYFGIRAEWVDMTEVLRRITLEIYDKDEYEKALAWVKRKTQGRALTATRAKILRHIITRSKVIAGRRRLGVYRQDDNCHARHTVSANDKLRQMGWLFEEARGKMLSQADFRVRETGWAKLAAQRRLYRGDMASTFNWNGPKAPTALQPKTTR